MREEAPPYRKYRNKPCELDGHRFASQREARRYVYLKNRARQGHIKALELQPRFKIAVNGRHICIYVADFRYLDTATGNIVIEDSKGMKTREYGLKKKLMRAVHGIDVVEV